MTGFWHTGQSAIVGAPESARSLDRRPHRSTSTRLQQAPCRRTARPDARPGVEGFPMVRYALASRTPNRWVRRRATFAPVSVNVEGSWEGVSTS